MSGLAREQSLSVKVDPAAADGVLAGVAATYGRDVERGPGLVMAIEPGAFSDQLKDPARIKILFQHQWENPIGRVTGFEDSEDVLRFEGKIIPHADRPLARQALADLREGLLDELSVGFSMVRWRTEDTLAADGTSLVRYVVLKARLKEISVVTFGAMGQDARVEQVHHDGSGSLAVLRAAEIRAQLARLRA